MPGRAKEQGWYVSYAGPEFPPLVEKATAWLQPPRLRSNEHGEHGRRATWLELFYDLVYVVAIAALASHLAHHLTPAGLAQFALLFLPVWWSWSGATFYNDRFDTDDLWHRVATLLLMLGGALLALNVPTAFEAPGFALAYAFVRAVLIANYVRVAFTVPTAAPLARRYAAGFSLAAALWVVSAFAPPAWRVARWVVALAIDLGTPLTARALQALMPVSQSHLPERIGLFTIIVLGEGVAAVVKGATEASLRLDSALAGAMGMALAFSLWWIYFANLDERVVRRTRLAGQVWFYGHFPLCMGLAAAAVGVEHLIVQAHGFHAPERWLLGGSVALCLASMGVIHLATLTPRDHATNRLRAVARLVSAAALLGVTAVGASFPPLAFGLMVTVVGVAQVLLDPPVRRPAAAS